MDLSAFFGVVATIDFALLGLWWVTVQTRPDLRRREGTVGRMAYLASLQFVVPGTAALLAQVAPALAAVWRIAFGLAGVTGIVMILFLVPALRAAGARSVANVLRFGALPVYGALTAIAATAALFDDIAQLKPLQVEAILFCLITFLGTEVAWAAAMSPQLDRGRPADAPESTGDRPRQITSADL